MKKQAKKKVARKTTVPAKKVAKKAIKPTNATDWEGGYHNLAMRNLNLSKATDALHSENRFLQAQLLQKFSVAYQLESIEQQLKQLVDVHKQAEQELTKLNRTIEDLELKRHAYQSMVKNGIFNLQSTSSVS
jgi:predicted RNase H-like nuclease (RuvC/YqgF family)